jgi:dihydroflavonol-4-reductase
MKIGITGASGHVGANLVRRILKDGYQVRVLQHRDHRALDGLALEQVEGDITRPETLDAFCRDLEVVFHAAAKISIGYNAYDLLYDTNVRGTMNLVEAAKRNGVRRFIHFSSIHALEHVPLDEPMDETRPLIVEAPMAYEKTKAMAQKWIMEQYTDDFEVIVLNPTSILGPYDFKLSLMGDFIRRLYLGTIPGLVPGGYNWVDVRDICEAAVQAIRRGKNGELYILSGHYMTVVQFAALLGEVTQKDLRKPVLPLWLARIGVPFLYAWARITGSQPLYTAQSLEILQSGNRHISNDKARNELGFNPRPLAESLKDTVNWMKENKYINA